MADAEAAAEAEAAERGEHPFLVSDAALLPSMTGGPLLSAEGEVMGVHTLIMSAGEGTTRYYAVSAERTARALDAMLDRRGLGEQVKGFRVCLLNDSINKRERVQAVLNAAGLSDQAAALAMLSAHKTGRGVIGYFADAAEAEALQVTIAELGKELPAPLGIIAEPCDFYQKSEATVDQAAA